METDIEESLSPIDLLRVYEKDGQISIDSGDYLNASQLLVIIRYLMFNLLPSLIAKF